ncbi:MAG: cytochrome c oxidase assembly protein [Candidatus Nanopelagicales bacterium]
MKISNLVFLKIPVVGVLFTFFITSNIWQTPAPLIPDSGPIVYWLRPVLVSYTYALAIAAVALLFSDGIFNKFDGKNSSMARSFFLGLSGVSFAAAVFSLAQSLSQPLSLAANLDVIATYGWDVSNVRALLLISLVALISFLLLIKPSLDKSGLVAFLNILALSLPTLLSHGGGISTHNWAIASGFFHGIFTSLWITGLAGIGLIYFNKSVIEKSKLRAINKFSFIATISVIGLAISGAVNAVTRLNNFSELLTTSYGQIIVIKNVLFALALITALNIRTRLKTNIYKLLVLEISILLFIFGVSVALASTAFPRTGNAAFNLIESVTGLPEPAKFQWSYALTTISIEPFTLFIGLIALISYLAGYIKLIKRGDKWPLSRVIFWSSGILLGIYVTNTMLGRYAILLFSAHMTVHMILAMVVPILLPLSAPLTLALRVLKPTYDPEVRNLREWIVAVINSKYLKVASHPIIAFFIFAAGTWALYFSPLLTVLMRSHLGHLFMDAHFVLAGYLFFWLIIGKDPAPRNIPDVLKLGIVFGAAVFHGIFGFITYSSQTILGGGWFNEIKPSWLESPITDQQLGGGIAWGFGEIPTIIVLLILVYQWASRDEKQAKRVTDKEIDDYNEYLKSLNR